MARPRPKSPKPLTLAPIEEAILVCLPARVAELCVRLKGTFVAPAGTEPDRYIERHIQRLRRIGLLEPRREGRQSRWYRTVRSSQAEPRP